MGSHYAHVYRGSLMHMTACIVTARALDAIMFGTIISQRTIHHSGHAADRWPFMKAEMHRTLLTHLHFLDKSNRRQKASQNQTCLHRLKYRSHLRRNIRHQYQLRNQKRQPQSQARRRQISLLLGLNNGQTGRDHRAALLLRLRLSFRAHA